MFVTLSQVSGYFRNKIFISNVRIRANAEMHLYGNHLSLDLYYRPGLALD